MIAGFGGVVYAMQTGLAVSDTGSPLLFPAVTAVFLGASQFSQRPNVWGTVIAYFTLAFGIPGVTITWESASAWAGPLFTGLALIAAVAAASRPVRQRLRSRRAITELEKAAAVTGEE